MLKLETIFDWHPGSEVPAVDEALTFKLWHDSTPRRGNFRNDVFVQSNQAGTVWPSDAIARWIYLDRDGGMITKSHHDESVRRG